MLGQLLKLVIGPLAIITIAACGSTEIPDDDSTVDAEIGTAEAIPEEIGEADSEVNGAGQCCWGHCSNTGPFCGYSVAENCREWVVATCHSWGAAFNPNGDAWWGSCGGC